jgi:hypothetical protein
MRREFSKQVKRDAFLRANGECEGCGAKLGVAQFHFDHIIPDGLGGEPTLDNCACLCRICHDVKTRTKDVPAIAKTKRISDKHLGIRKPSRLQSAGFQKMPPQHSASRPIARKRPCFYCKELTASPCICRQNTKGCAMPSLGDSK